MEDLKTQFEKASSYVRNLPKEGPINPTDDERLELYSYYKQATEGDNKTSKPWMINLEASKKWNSWKALENMSKEEAMKKYIEALKRISKDDFKCDIK